MLKIAILGGGWAGTRHVEAIRELTAHTPTSGKAAVACLVDNDADFLSAKAQELGIDCTYTDYRQALDDPQVDAVSICLPHALHCTVTEAAAQAGKHILVEKPMAMGVDEATRMIAAAEDYGVKLYVAENVPYESRTRRLREIVQNREYIGELTFASLTKGFAAQHYGYEGRRAWLSTPELGGSGAWLLNGIHSVAELRYVLGEVTTVYMREHKASSFERQDVEATMSGLLTLESGIPVWITQTAETRIPHRLRGFGLYGDAGVVRAGVDGYEVYSEALDSEETPKIFAYPESALSSYALEIEAFADYVATGRPGPTTARSERRSLAIVEAGYESARSGSPVDLKARFGDLG